MKKQISCIYQYYKLYNFRWPYIRSIASYTLLIAVHLFLLQNILSSTKITKDWVDFNNVFLNLHFIEIFIFVAIIFFLSIFSRNKLLEIKFDELAVKRRFYKLGQYFLAVAILCIISTYFLR